MARIRSIKPEFWTSGQIIECSPMTRLLFIGLWNFCDDAGRMPFRPKQIKAQIFPADDLSADAVRRMIDELSTNGLVVIYAVEEQEFLQVTGWHHQKIDRPNRSTIPPPPQNGSSNDRRTLDAGRDRKGEERKGVERENPEAAQPSPARVHVHEAATGRDFDQLEAALRGAAGLVKDPSPALCNLGPIVGLIDAGFSLEWEILPVLRAKAAAGKRGRSWAFYVEAIREAKAGRSAAAQHPPDQRGVTEAEWRARCDRWFTARHWPSPFGPDPDMAGCEAPKPIIEAARAAARQREFA
jgi:hypothetical protein